MTRPIRKRRIRSRPADASVASARPGEFLNRELSWLEFNRRVLAEALDARTPLLERVKFLAIFSSNFDEFFMRRVGGLKQQIAASVLHTTPDGMTPVQELAAIRKAVLPLVQRQAECFEQQIKPELRRNGIHLLNWKDLSESEREFVKQQFKSQVFPILTPLSVDPGHPFPYLSNLSTSLGITLRHPDNPDEKLFARVKVPEILPQWIRLPGDEEQRFVHLRDTILNNLAELFPGMVIMDVMPFRITRNAEVELDELDAEDLLELIESELRERRFATVLRLEHGPNPDPWILKLLCEELGLGPDDLYELPGELEHAALKPIAELNIPNLKYEQWVPADTPVLADEDGNVFSAIRRGDFLVHHPYESFASSVERFVRAAVEDPRVVAIKVTLYRTGENSAIVPLLLKAAEAGKQVVCVIELKAYLDEARNIAWAQAMEKSGVHVIYGLVGLKTHAKVILVVRHEHDGMRCYAHVGTGNYHSQNANVYTDLGILTADRALTSELVEVFNFLTGRSLKREYEQLLVAPFNMKARFIAMIQRETAHARAGRPAHVIAKINSLEDHGIIRALYEASQAGVEIDLLVRGLCCLRPGIKDLSDRIRVVSIVGRLLEHSRIFYFKNGAADPLDGEYFIGSADWMYRNLLSRVEIVTPIVDKKLRERCREILTIMLADDVQAWDMQSDGTYRRRTPAAGSVGSQTTLMRLARERSNQYLKRLEETRRELDVPIVSSGLPSSLEGRVTA